MDGGIERVEIDEGGQDLPESVNLAGTSVNLDEHPGLWISGSHRKTASGRSAITAADLTCSEENRRLRVRD